MVTDYKTLQLELMSSCQLKFPFNQHLPPGEPLRPPVDPRLLDPGSCAESTAAGKYIRGGMMSGKIPVRGCQSV